MSTVRLQRTDISHPERASKERLSSSPATAQDPELKRAKKRPNRRQKLFRKWQIAVLLGVIVLVVSLVRARQNRTTVDADLIYHTVTLTDLDISVTERGNLASQTDLQVVCEVDDVPGDNISGTPILWIIDNGASVKKGDLIVELDASPIQDRLDQQILELEEERAEYRQAEVEFANQKTQNETNLSEARLAVELAELALQQFGDTEAGTFQIDLQAIELEVQQAEAERLIEQTNLKGVETLYKLGYRSSGELAQARLNALRTERALANAISKRRELVEYQFKKMKMELEGALASAERTYEQTVRDNEARLAAAHARLLSSKEQLAKEEELYERYQNQLAKCKIYAPQDGMVAYYSGNGRYRREEIRAGAHIRPRQPILTLPNLNKMQVETAVHESVLDMIANGLKATVRVDAFPDMQHEGTVATVAVLPDQSGWMSSDTKVYETVVTIDGTVEQLKPGMTAVVEIHVAHLKDVLAIPVQSIVQIGSETWCYVEQGGQPVRRFITLGMTNNKYVEVREGLQAGERVVLNPSAIPDNKSRSVKDQDEPAQDHEAETPEAEVVQEIG